MTMMDTTARGLRDLVAMIEDPDVRLEQGQAVEEWIKSAPTKTLPHTCPGCGRKGHGRKGRICTRCMKAIVDTAVTESKGFSPNGEALSLEKRTHWNQFPFLGGDTPVPEDATFYTRPREGHGSVSAMRAFEHLMSDLGALALAGFDGVPSGVRTESLMGGTSYGSDVTRGLAPAGFKDAYTNVVYFVAWATEVAYRDGFSKGQNLLASMAAGTLTHEAFTEKVIQTGEQSERRISDMSEKKMRPR